METLGVSFNVPLIPIPISDSASFGAQQYGHSHHKEIVPKKPGRKIPKKPGRKIPKAVFTTSGINNPILKIKNKQSGICHIEAIIIATLPIKDCPGVKITVDGEIILLTHTNNANIKAANIIFSIRIRFLLIQNFFRLIDIEYTE